MELLEWIKFGGRWLLLGSWLFLLFKITNYLATDKVFSFAFWAYVVIHTLYVAFLSYKDIEEL